MDKRAAAFARLFEAVHEGVYIGTIGPESTATIAAASSAMGRLSAITTAMAWPA